jgi:hypothetical protein
MSNNSNSSNSTSFSNNSSNTSMPNTTMTCYEVYYANESSIPVISANQNYITINSTVNATSDNITAFSVTLERLFLLANNTNDYDIKVDTFDAFWFRSFISANYSI